MIKKIFGEYTCDSCGKQTPVSFVIYDPVGLRINTVGLCRECSNKFAEDVIDSLRKKISKNLEVIEKQANVKRSLKKKITQMNRKSHNHKEVITNLYRGKSNER